MLMFPSEYWKLTFTYLGIFNVKEVPNENQQIKQTEKKKDKQKLEESIHQSARINGKVTLGLVFWTAGKWGLVRWLSCKGARTQASYRSLTEGKTRLQKDIPWSSCVCHAFPTYPKYIKKMFSPHWVNSNMTRLHHI